MQETWVDKLVQQDLTANVRRFALGASLSAAIGFGWPAFVATAAIGTAISGVEFHFDKRRKDKRLLELYKHEIGALRHKAPDDLTLDDARIAAAPKEQGGDGLKALQEGLDHYKWDHKFRWAMNLATSAIVTATLVAAAVLVPSFLPNLESILGLGLVGAGYVAVNRTVRGVTELALGHQDETETFNKELLEISQQIKKEPLSPVQALALFVEGSPELAAQVKARFGCDFKDLTSMQKKQVLAQTEPALRIGRLTEEINKGEIRPSFLGLLVKQQADLSADNAKYRAIFTEPVRTRQDEPEPPRTRAPQAAPEQQKPPPLFAQRIVAERDAPDQGIIFH